MNELWLIKQQVNTDIWRPTSEPVNSHLYHWPTIILDRTLVMSRHFVTFYLLLSLSKNGSWTIVDTEVFGPLHILLIFTVLQTAIGINRQKHETQGSGAVKNIQKKFQLKRTDRKKGQRNKAYRLRKSDLIWWWPVHCPYRRQPTPGGNMESGLGCRLGQLHCPKKSGAREKDRSMLEGSSQSLIHTIETLIHKHVPTWMKEYMAPTTSKEAKNGIPTRGNRQVIDRQHRKTPVPSFALLCGRSFPYLPWEKKW